MTTETLPGRARPVALQPDEGETIENLGLRVLASDADTGGQLTAAICTNPGPGGPPLHTHAAVDELYLVLAGRYRFRIGDDVTEGGAGTFAYVPRGVTHSFASVGPEEGRIFALTLPGTEGFLRGMSALQDQGLDQQAMVDHFHAYATEIDGPPLV
ncbi:MAG TPA: cupin domain-containing protein [Chloroflexota bacterium]|nr:cupin domain-containing protein [Chloroflexota bacterium]